MKLNPRRTTVVGAGLFLLLLTASIYSSAAASAEPKVDVRVLIDISGSMKKNDPNNLRRPALRLLVGLLPAGTRAGVWTFGQYVNMQVPLGEVDEAWKKRAREGAEKVHSRGLFTHIEAVLKKSTEDWEKADSRYQRHLILLTDGMVDVSKKSAESAASRQRILDEVVPRLKSIGAKTHTIALSDRADHELMKVLAGETDGWYEKVENADRLQRIFLRIFEKVGKPDALPLKDNRFHVDKSIKEVTLLVFRSDETDPTRIVTPSGQGFGAEDAVEGVTWHRDQGYDLLTVKTPEAGEWRIQAQLDPDNRVMVLTDLKMKATELPTRFALGENIPFAVWFDEQGKRILRKNFLDKIEVKSEVYDSNGISEPRPLRDKGLEGDREAGDGRFGFLFGEALAEGSGELVLVAEGKSFVREQHQLYEVRTPFILDVEEQEQNGEAGVAIRLTPDTQVVRKEGLSVEAHLKSLNDERRIELLAEPDGQWQAWVETASLSEPSHIHVTVSGTSRAGNPINLELEPVPVGKQDREVVAPLPESPEPAAAPVQPAEEAASPEDGSGYLILLAGNLVLILLGVGGYLFIRRRRRGNLVQLVEEEGEESEAKAGKEESA